MPKQSIAFRLAPAAEAIVRRAATKLNLTVVDLLPAGICVELTDAIDAYRLGDLTASDPAWAPLFVFKDGDMAVALDKEHEEGARRRAKPRSRRRRG